MSLVYLVRMNQNHLKETNMEIFELLEEIKKQANKNKLSFVYTTTGEKALHKLYEKNSKIDLCENNIRSYIMALNNSKKLDWISYKHG